MLTFFRINSEETLEWRHDPQDLITFIVVVAETQHKFGVSTYVLSNRKHQKIITAKLDMAGLFSVRVASGFDVKTETGVGGLTKGMKVVGLSALRAFLEAKRDRPFVYADLKRVLKHSEDAANALNTDDREETEDLGYASPSFLS